VSTEDAFRRLVDEHRRSLHAHCYRMLGSPHDADDALQDTLVRAWRGLSGFREGAPVRPWLFKIATNVCLDEIARRPRRVIVAADRPPSAPTDEPTVPLTESAWLEPYPDEPSATYERRESVELAFVAALQHLPARQRAVLLLREVLGFSAREVAASLETTEASVNSAMQRARSAISARVPAQSQQATLSSLGDGRVRELVERYVAAWERHDIEALRTLLVEDAIFAMPPFAEWWQGRDAIIEMYSREPELRLRGVSVRANGQPAVAWYVWAPDREVFAASSIEVFTLRGARIEQVTAFVMPELFPRFGLATDELRESGR
jgi:RNA polymerase sigma-70 factor (ECF subfamily)